MYQNYQPKCQKVNRDTKISDENDSKTKKTQTQNSQTKTSHTQITRSPWFATYSGVLVQWEFLVCAGCWAQRSSSLCRGYGGCSSEASSFLPFSCWLRDIVGGLKTTAVENTLVSWELLRMNPAELRKIDSKCTTTTQNRPFRGESNR